jgi:hypothetical protein
MHSLARSYLCSHELSLPYINQLVDSNTWNEDDVLFVHSISLENCVKSFEEILFSGVFVGRTQAAQVFDEYGRALMYTGDSDFSEKGLDYRLLAQKEFDRQRQSF